MKSTILSRRFTLMTVKGIWSLNLSSHAEFLKERVFDYIKSRSSNFNFNREINDLRIKKMRVMLPVTDAGEPDYQFMEDYIRELMAKKKKQYLGFLKLNDLPSVRTIPLKMNDTPL